MGQSDYSVAQLAATPSVAVVIPCWNAEKWIARAIQSVLDQDYPNIEVVVIDDGSTDGSLRVIRSFGDRIRWETGANRGAPAARNRGLALTSSDYIMFLDADDYIDRDSLRSWIAKAGKADVVFGRFVTESCGLRAPGPAVRSERVEDVLHGWLGGCGTPPCAVLWQKSFLEQIGGWRLVEKNDDGELCIRALICGARVAMADDGLGIWVQHDSPSRVSRRRGAEAILSEHTAFRELEKLANSRGVDLRYQLARAYYRMAYEAFALEAIDIGNRALSDARRLGLRGHVGSITHRTLAALLGLRIKMRLTGYLKGRHKQLGARSDLRRHPAEMET
jgi:glycosyltransferase involved in cell wall biosynthesis